MKRILLRAPQSPFDNLTALKTICEDKIWSNVGNLLFAQSVYKTLYNDNTQITIMDLPASAYEPSYINKMYDIIILPFANAFRKDFIPKLNEYTKLIQKINIPVVVVGIGAQQSIDKMDVLTFDYDRNVSEFIKAVLQHSESIGVRGEYTRRYLDKLGFGNHVRVIGCPSMYMFGDELPKQPIQVPHAYFKLNLNGKSSDSERIRQYLFGTGEQCTFVPQGIRELKMLYTGLHVKNNAESYPYRLDSPTLEHMEIRFPLSVYGWIELLKQGNMSIGTRIHGSIASILSGLPTFLICTDSRTLELAEYHQIPHCIEKDFDFSQTVYELYKNYDFSRVYEGHVERYNNYLNFMKENGVEIHKSSFALFEKKSKEIKWKKALTPITKVDESELLRRINLYYNKKFS